MPRVSIGLPVHNGDRYLEATLAALCAQTYGDLEIIISDNASTDRTREICLDFAGRDSRVHYYRQGRNVGAARNYNRVWELARGELFKWAAHDDLCAPTLIARCVKALDGDRGTVLSYPRTVLIDADGRPVRSYQDGLDLTSPHPAERFRRYLFRSAQECNAVFGVIRAAALRRTRLIGSFNASDRVLLAELALQGKFREIDEELFFRRDHPGTSLRANRDPFQVAVWFDPDRRRRLLLPVWRLHGELARCVLRSELGPWSRLQCLILVARGFWRQRQGWGREVSDLLKRVWMGLPPPRGKEFP